MAASDQSDWYSSDESDNESRFSGRNSDVSSNIIGNGHTLDRDSDLESCESDLEEDMILMLVMQRLLLMTVM